jgi:cation diffusion facilitator CzcD-associated flavoprotein CzcO
MTRESDVLILGGGPAGLSCARALRGLGVHNTILLERESALGGIPRHCGHPGFGLREFGKVYTGPDYAKRLTDEASGADLKPRMSVLNPTGRRTSRPRPSSSPSARARCRAARASFPAGGHSA